MSTDELEVERHAGIDMVPMGESFEMNSGPDDGALGSFATTLDTKEFPRYERFPKW